MCFISTSRSNVIPISKWFFPPHFFSYSGLTWKIVPEIKTTIYPPVYIIHQSFQFCFPEALLNLPLILRPPKVVTSQRVNYQNFMKLKVAFFYTTGGLERPSHLRGQLSAPVHSRSFTNPRRCLPLWAPLHPQSEEMYQQPLQQCQEARVRVAADPGGLSARPLRDDPSHTWGSSRPTAPTHNFGFVAPNKQTAPIVKPPFKFPQTIVLSLLNGRAVKQRKRGLGFPSHLINK